MKTNAEPIRGEFELWKQPKIYGSWIIGDKNTFYHCRIGSNKKVNWFHIKMMRLLLGIDWEAKHEN